MLYQVNANLHNIAETAIATDRAML